MCLTVTLNYFLNLRRMSCVELDRIIWWQRGCLRLSLPNITYLFGLVMCSHYSPKLFGFVSHHHMLVLSVRCQICRLELQHPSLSRLVCCFNRFYVLWLALSTIQLCLNCFLSPSSHSFEHNGTSRKVADWRILCITDRQLLKNGLSKPKDNYDEKTTCIITYSNLCLVLDVGIFLALCPVPALFFETPACTQVQTRQLGQEQSLWRLEQVSCLVLNVEISFRKGSKSCCKQDRHN